MNLDKQIAEILNAVFEHGKQTPDKSYDLPEGQTTIAEAIVQLKALILKTCEEEKEKLINKVDTIMDIEQAKELVETNQQFHGMDGCVMCGYDPIHQRNYLLRELKDRP
jgi:hypothetical protein